MIYCGSSSCFGKVSVPVPVPYPNLFITVFQQQKIVQNLAFSMLVQHCFPESWPLIFGLIFVTFYVASWFKSGSGTRYGMHDYSFGSAKVKSCGSCSTTLVARL